MKEIINTAGGQNPALSTAKRALLSKWLRDGPQSGADRQNGSIPTRPDTGSTGLSFQQQRFWFFYQLDAKSAMYTMPIGTRLRGTLDPQALHQALNLVVARHEILRTRFVGEQPRLVTDEARPIDLTQIDLRRLPSNEREAEAHRLLTADAKRPFDLSRDLMMRATLVRLEDNEWIFLLLQHHIASDDWSWRVLCDEVADSYQAICAGRNPQLPQLPIQYADFAAWQKQGLCGATLENLFSQWRKKLAGAPHVLELPTDHPRPATQTFRGACEWREVPQPLMEDLKRFGQRAGATPFMVLFATFQTLLHRYSGQDDFLVASPVAGRMKTSVQNSIGLFVNTLVMRADLSGEPTFNELLQRVQATVIEALAHQELPFDKLVHELDPERSPSHPPLVQVMFALQDELSENLRLPGVAVSPYHVETDTAKFDLTFTIVQSVHTNWRCCVEYNIDLYDRGTAARLLEHFERLLQAVLLNPENKVSHLPLLSKEERQQLIKQWNRTEADYPWDKCVHELFAAQAAANPDAVALVCGGVQLCYRELNRRANQLARRLVALGAGPERIVAVVTDRSVDMVIALLAILKAGAAYLPLDPTYPLERLRFMLHDSGASLLIRQSSFTAAITSENIQTLCLDTDWPQIAKERDDELAPTSTPHNLAYVIYTSGSTGQPKGAEILHRSLVNLLHAIRREPGLNKDDTLLSVTSISFDMGTLEIFLPLLSGARLVVAETPTVFDVTRLARLISDSNVTVMQATPTLWRALVESGWKGDAQLKIFTGGEPLTRELADELLDRSAEVWNLYGPTETTIYSTGCKIERDGQPITIGRPLANTQIYLLDRYLQPVPRGFPGSLYIGGDGLARGYLNRPALTAEKFVPNPFGEYRSLRLYDSGDIARYRPDGKIECLGRCDSQVKLRGHRIDLGEVECILRQHPRVREAVVILREDVPGQKRLVGYVIGASNVVPDCAELLALLRTKLPAYMIPESLVALDKFPTTPNGKINRKALPPPGTCCRPKENLAPPLTPVEEELAGIWRDVMKRDHINREDNFFEIGGHSLAAMKVLSRARKAFNANITIRDILETPTIAGLASVIAAKRVASAHSQPQTSQNF